LAVSDRARSTSHPQAWRTSGRSAAAPLADHGGRPPAAKQQVSGREPSFGHRQARGFYRGKLDDSWDPAIQRRLNLFLGSENYDNRIDNGGLFDLEVLADLRLRYGNKADGLAPGQRAR
jgi:hypothetical protein